jgi:hypothetical protein
MVPVQPCLPIHTVGLRSCIDESFFSGIWSHHTVSHFFIAGLAGDHDIAA